MGESLSKARFAALEAVKQIRENNAFARDVLDQTLQHHVLSPQDKAFATKLALGSTQTRCTLNNMIYKCVDSPGDIQENVMDALRISTYEIVYLEKEAHAAVDQGVELVKTVEPRAKGLANLVLRRVVKLAKDFPFGNPDENFDAFCRVYSVPKWMGEMVVEDLGDLYGKNLIASCNGQPPTYIFVNTLKTSLQEMNDLLYENGAKPYIIKGINGIATNNCIKVENAQALRDANIAQAYDEGKFIICDVASQAIAASTLLTPENPNNILEFCCGKGNKTIMLQVLAQQKWGRQLDMFSLDNVGFKTDILKKRIEKTNVNVTAILDTDATNFEQLSQTIDNEFNGFAPKFDVVFVDAPCSGLGTLRRHPELKWRISPEVIDQLADTGLKILRNASKYVNKGGHLTYATCTVTKKENEDLCIKFLESEEGKNFKLLQFEYNGEAHPCYSTQTLGGLNDAHFSATFQKK
ncbi:MAG: transcription antitermination factor NusB [Coriobacteriia bacterium]|nr:transcription antitermination factor NusB [Coriobacteriia bacterium]